MKRRKSHVIPESGVHICDCPGECEIKKIITKSIIIVIILYNLLYLPVWYFPSHVHLPV